MTPESTREVGWTIGQGRYEVKRKLGEGGMALALLALDKTSGADVVLKVPKPAIMADPDFAHRFKREIRSMQELTHDHIVKIKDVGEHEGIPFYVMDLLAGGSLQDRFEMAADGNQKPMPPDSLADWLAPVAHALDFIHQRFVHRDIKPANILFDAYGNAFVSDFGIVKAIADGSNETKQTVVTQAGMVIGTGPFMAPEASGRTNIDGRVDQYALAATVYQALSGRLPFDGTFVEIIKQQLIGKIPPLHELVPTLPRSLTQVIEKGLSQDPTNRYATCSAFAKAVLDSVKALSAAGVPRGAKIKAGPKAVCPACRKAFSLPPDPAGKSVTCPTCGAGFTVANKAAETSRLPTRETPTRRQGLSATTPPAGRERNPFSVLSETVVQKATSEEVPAKAQRRVRPVHWAVAAAGAVFLSLLMWVGGIILRVPTKDGILVVEVDEPNPEVYVDGQMVTVKWDKGGKKAEIKITPGTQKVEVKKNGFTVKGGEVELKEGGSRILVARFERIPPPMPLAGDPVPKVEPPPPPIADGFVPLFNGKDLTGWKTHPKQPGNWRVEKGELISPDSGINHFYTERGDYKNFRLRAEIRITDKGGGAICFRSPFGPRRPPKASLWPQGYAVAIHGIKEGGVNRTGTLFSGDAVVVGIRESPTPDNDWFILELIADGNHITAKLNGHPTLDFVDDRRSFTSGHIVLQKHGVTPTIEAFRKIEIQELP
jgi:hypothetical protein